MVPELMVARYSSIRPVQRIKHVIDLQTAVPVNTKLENSIAIAVDAPTLGAPKNCLTGSKINAFFIVVECVASETDLGSTPNFYMTIWKNPGGNLTQGNGNSVGSNDNKNKVIHQEMVMINNVSGGTPRTIFKGVIVIPKGMRRMSPNDVWNVQFFIPSTGITVNACMQVHYKEFR